MGIFQEQVKTCGNYEQQQNSWPAKQDSAESRNKRPENKAEPESAVDPEATSTDSHRFSEKMETPFR